jgi:hypothetical protein
MAVSNRAESVAAPASASEAVPEPAPEPEPEPEIVDFNLCMDAVCESDENEDVTNKGRCRCSNQLVRIEKVLRDIGRIQNEADKESKELEIIMNVSNSYEVQDILDSAYASIESIEKKSNIMAARRLDSEALVAEGYPLQQYGLEKCSPSLDGVDDYEKEARQKEYTKFIEKDCAAYTKILTDKLDAVSNFMTQVKKNRELFYENERKKINQLDYGACLEEYNSCAKMECGANFSSCIEGHRLYTMLQKCQAVNYGKCEDSKLQVILDVKKYVVKELRKVALAHNCRSALGDIVDGRCLFRVVFRADKCGVSIFTAGCGSQKEKLLAPGGSTHCSKGSFGHTVPGCYSSCYLVGPSGDSKYLGMDKDTSARKTAKRVGLGIISLGITEVVGLASGQGDQFQCQSPSVGVPLPSGWGTDGYPTDPELSEAMKGGGY